MREPFKYTTCAICGKKFLKSPGSIYRVLFAGQSCQCCSYTCYLQAKRTKEATVESDYVKERKKLRNEDL